MPLQWLPLQQRQKQAAQPRAVVSEALTPRRMGAATMGAMPAGKGFMEKREEQMALEAERKHELKLMDKKLEIAKFAAGLEEDAAKGITVGQALGQAPAAEATEPASTLTKENMPETAMEVWKFISTLEPESQKFYIQRLKQKEEPTGYIEMGEKRVEVPGSVGMYRYLVDQGLIDTTTDTIIEKERVFEKGTFEIVEEGGKVYQLNTATGERKQLGTVDKPEGVVNAITKQIKSDALALIKAKPNLSLEDATHDAAIDYGLSEEASVEIAKFKEMPEGAKKKNAILEWFKNIGKAKVPSGYQRKGAGAGVSGAVPITGEPTFDETNVTTLIDTISDDVTTAERAHFKSQGASDSDIDEAIRRKVSK